MADQAILTSLAVSSSPQGRYICSQNDLACVGPDKAELGLALIGARRGPASTAALAALVRYRLDAGLGEDYQCYVLKNGKPLRDRLLAVKPAELQEECHLELTKLIKGKTQQFEGLDEGSVCRDQSSMRKQIKELVEAINRGRKCSEQDF